MRSQDFPARESNDRDGGDRNDQSERDGFLQPNDNYQQALHALESVDELGWSHRKAARYSDVPRRTIPPPRNLPARKDLYLTHTPDEK